MEFARKMIKDTIWKEAYIEGVNATFPETEQIFEGYAPKNFSVNEIITINNLKNAWQLIFNNLGYDIDVNLLRDINKKIGEGGLISDAGILRIYPVTISGTEYVPNSFIDYETVKNSLLNIEKNTHNATQRALTQFSTICREQWFSNGNKRTAQLVCNHTLIKNGCGILSIPVISKSSKNEFSKLLTDFYETNNAEKLHKWLYDNAIKGIKKLNTPKEIKDAEEKRKKWNLQHGFAL
jgi:Fic family protein